MINYIATLLGRKAGVRVNLDGDRASLDGGQVSLAGGLDGSQLEVFPLYHLDGGQLGVDLHPSVQALQDGGQLGAVPRGGDRALVGRQPGLEQGQQFQLLSPRFPP